MNKQTIKKLKRTLPKGYAKIIASRLNISERWVYYKLKSFDPEIVEQALILAREEQNKKVSLASDIKNL